MYTSGVCLFCYKTVMIFRIQLDVCVTFEQIYRLGVRQYWGSFIPYKFVFIFITLEFIKSYYNHPTHTVTYFQLTILHLHVSVH